MVDLNGNVLAHPEKEKVLFVSNLISSPIVQEMLKSSLNNGQKRFLEDDQYYIGSFKKIDSISGGIISIVPENKIFEEVYNYGSTLTAFPTDSFPSCLLPTGIFANTNYSAEINLFPNPAKDMLRLELKNFSEQIVELTVINVYGETVMEEKKLS